MSETLAAGGRELRVARETLLKIGGYEADRQFAIVFVQSSATTSPRELRQRVRKIDTDARAKVAREFAKRASAIAFVRELWLDDDGDQSVLHAIVEGASLDDELELEAVLTGVLAERPNLFDGYLQIHAAEEEIPPIARKGYRLLPQ